MRKIKFDSETINQIKDFAKEHTLMETCNRFTLTPIVLKRLSKQYSITFAYKAKDSSVVISTTNYSLAEVIAKYTGYNNIHEDSNGNVVCNKPTWYTGRPNSNVVFLHNLIICHALGISCIPKGFMVVHIDGDARNLNIDNLMLCTIAAGSNLNLCKVQRSAKCVG